MLKEGGEKDKREGDGKSGKKKIKETERGGIKKKVEKPTVKRAGLSSPIGLVFTPTMGLDTKVLYYPISNIFPPDGNTTRRAPV